MLVSSEPDCKHYLKAPILECALARQPVGEAVIVPGDEPEVAQFEGDAGRGAQVPSGERLSLG